MPTHDFTALIDRTTQGSSKWLAMRQANPGIAEGIPPFSVADLDFPHPPEIMDGLRQYLDEVVFGYTLPTPAYTRSVLDWMASRHAWQVDPDSLLQTSGVVSALCTAVRALTQPGEGVIVQTPVYYPFYTAIESNQRKVVRNPLVLENGHYRMDIEGLRQLAKDPDNRLLMFCSPHNPVGRVWTREELEEVARIVIENDLILISDEIHADLILPGHQHTIMATLGKDIAQRSVICTSPSKTFNLAGMAVSNIMIEDSNLRLRFRQELESQGFFSLTTLAYKACELAYTQGGPWLSGLLKLIEHNHLYIAEFMRKHLPEVGVLPLEGTYLQWLDLRALKKSPAELKHLHQQQAQVFFNEGTLFGEEGTGFARMNIATSTAALEAALQRLVASYTA